LKEDDVLISDSLLFWQNWYRYSREPSAKHLPQKIEVTVAALAFPHALFVFTLYIVHDVTAHVLRTRNTEVVLKVIHKYISFFVVRLLKWSDFLSVLSVGVN